MIKAYIATALIAAAVAAGGTWKVLDWRYTASAAKQAEAFDTERKSWDAKVAAAEKQSLAQRDENRARADASNAQHSADLLKLNAQIKGSRREIDRLSDNLSACKLNPDLVRLLNAQRAAIASGAGKD